MQLKQLIENKAFEALEQALLNHPHLANEGMPYDELNTAMAHPLHHICDGVFSSKYSEEEALTMAKLFLANGANVNGGELKEKQDTPLIAAASLGADQVGILYMENGADIYHPGTHGGTALHWAAWCGREKLVKRLIEAGAEINKLCMDFTSTPLFWTVHGYRSCGKQNAPSYLECVRLLGEAGADPTIPNFEGYTVFDLLHENDQEFISLLKSK